MAGTTEIAWCDSTFNPWIGCMPVSPCCDRCYAAVSTPARRFGVEWGHGKPRHRTAAANWKLPLRWNAQLFYECPCGRRGTVRDLTSNGHHCSVANFKSARRRVFCASLADVFDNEVDPQWRADLLSLIEQTPNLDWLVLTKRIGNVVPMLTALRDSEANTVLWRFLDRWVRGFPPEHVWLGSTVGFQTEANRDVPKLLATPAHIRFLSMEPLLGRVDLTAIDIPLSGTSRETVNVLHRKDGLNLGSARPSIDWVIVGGESGHGARPMHPEWARSLRDQCESAGVPYLFKQWGNWAIDEQPEENRSGAALMANPRRVRVNVDGQTAVPSAIESLNEASMTNIGKRLAGRELDGQTHNGYPAAKS